MSVTDSDGNSPADLRAAYESERAQRAIYEAVILRWHRAFQESAKPWTYTRHQEYEEAKEGLIKIAEGIEQTATTAMAD